VVGTGEMTGNELVSPDPSCQISRLATDWRDDFRIDVLDRLRFYRRVPDIWIADQVADLADHYPATFLRLPAQTGQMLVDPEDTRHHLTGGGRRQGKSRHRTGIPGRRFEGERAGRDHLAVDGRAEGQRRPAPVIQGDLIVQFQGSRERCGIPGARGGEEDERDDAAGNEPAALVR